jgi:hypothetical protein
VRGIIIMEKQDDDKKTTVAEAFWSSGTLRSSSKSSAESQVYSYDEDEAPSALKVARMVSSSIIRAQQLPNELIGFGSPVLDILMGSLDERSLKNCRGVCKSWEDAARRALMKRCGLQIEAFFKAAIPSEQNRVELYSSWIFEYKSLAGRKRKVRTLAWTNFLRNWGNLAKSLTLKGLIPDAECLVWMRRLLCVWCRNVAELSLEFNDREESRRVSQQSVRQEMGDFRQYLDDGNEVDFKQIWMDKENHAFAPYPVLHNIQSLRVGKISDPVTTFLSINVILAVPNLKRLFISEHSLCEPKRLMDVLSRLNSLKHLDWTISIPVHLYETLAEDGQKKMPSLEFCHLRVPYLVCPLDPENAVEMQQFQAKRAQILEMLLKTKQSACKFVVTTSNANIFAMEKRGLFLPRASAWKWKALLFHFITTHRLPIEFRYSPAEEHQGF